MPRTFQSTKHLFFYLELMVAFFKQAADQDSKPVIIAAMNHGTTREPFSWHQQVGSSRRLCESSMSFMRDLWERIEAPFTIHTTLVTNYNWVGGPETHAFLRRFHWVQLDIIQDTVYASLPVRRSGQTLFGCPRSPEKISSIKNSTKTNEKVKLRPVEAIIDAGAVYSMISEDMI